MAERKLDIFEAMAAVDRRDLTWFERQPEDARKELAPPVFLRWVSSIEGKKAGDVLIATNLVVNRDMWSVASEYPGLFFKLATLTSTGKQQKHVWTGMPGRKGGGKAFDLIATFLPSANDAEIAMLMRSTSRQDFQTFINDTAIPDAEAKEVLRAYDKFHGEKAQPKKARGRKA